MRVAIEFASVCAGALILGLFVGGVFAGFKVVCAWAGFE
jgi:hypothetical protein